jgi:hypothetical protein
VEGLRLLRRERGVSARSGRITARQAAEHDKCKGRPRELHCSSLFVEISGCDVMSGAAGGQPEPASLSFGPQWRQKAPLALGYSRRQVQRWAAGTAQPPRRVLILLNRRAVRARSDIEAGRNRNTSASTKQHASAQPPLPVALTPLKLLGIRALRRSQPIDGEPAYLQHGTPRR